MTVTALHIRLLMHFSMVVVACVQQSYPHASDTAFSITPTRLQLFEYESVSFSCEGFNVSAGWKVRNIKELISTCSDGPGTSGITCTIEYAFVTDSGEYWCEGGGGERSNTVNITVTAGSVILESPVLPVMEGETVTLRCRSKSFSNLTAHFYKDDLLIGTSITGNMTIHSVSKSHEGLYKCVSGAEESPVSPLTVRVQIPKCNGSMAQSEDRAASHREIPLSLLTYILLWIAVPVVLTLQMLMIGLLGWKKQLVLLELEMNDPKEDLYSVVKKYKKKDTANASDNLSNWLERNQSTKPQTEKEPTVSSSMEAAPVDPPPAHLELEYYTFFV